MLARPATSLPGRAGSAPFRLCEPMIPVNELSTSGRGQFDCGETGESVEAKCERPAAAAEGNFVPASFINDPQYWRKRADEAHSLADATKDEISKRKMVQMADDYEHLAKRAKQRAKL